MSKKKRKVSLPCDRTGEPIMIDDVLQWGDGTRFQVAYMTYYGGKDKDCWTAESEDGEFSDNLGASLIVWRKKVK